MRNHFLRAATDTGPPSSNAWDIGFAEFTATPQNFVSVQEQEISPQGVFFKSDGTVMYVVGVDNDRVYQYDLSTAWEVSTATYSTKSFSVVSQDQLTQDLFFKSDGTKMYAVGYLNDNVYEYDLSTAWDVSTASYSQSFSVATEDGVSLGLFFKPDGTKMYVSGSTNDSIYEYTLSTAWDISTASYSQSYNVSTQESTPNGVFFKSDGTVMYVVGSSNDQVYQYSLSTAWDVSTATYVQSFSVSFVGLYGPAGLSFKSDGTKMYVIGNSSDGVFEFSLSTAWDISTASFTYPSTDYFSVAAQEILPTGIFFKPDGTKMYVLGYSGDNVNEYSLSTAWQISTASYVQNFSVAAEEGTSQGLFFKPDGTKMYVIGSQGDDVNEYSLSTAWDISTASYVQRKWVAPEDNSPSAVFFKDDGTKMYITGTTGRNVYEYSLSTAWDISTASYDQNFSTGSTQPTGLFFKDDGSKMYVCNFSSDRVTSYSLSSAWDISTASSVNEFSLVLYEAAPRNIFFKPDGTKMFIAGSNSDAVWAFDIS